MGSKKILLGLLAGAAAGALAGILFAPEKGSVTRQNISDIAEDCAEALKRKMRDYRESIGEKIEASKEEIKNTMMNSNEDALNETKEKLNTSI